MEIIGVTGDAYSSTFYDSFGNVHTSRVEIDGDAIRWVGEGTRCTATFTDGGMTQVAHHESSRDGVTWSASMEVTLRKNACPMLRTRLEYEGVMPIRPWDGGPNAKFSPRCQPTDARILRNVWTCTVADSGGDRLPGCSDHSLRPGIQWKSSGWRDSPCSPWR